jgi:hypothetical protein
VSVFSLFELFVFFDFILGEGLNARLPRAEVVVIVIEHRLDYAQVVLDGHRFNAAVLAHLQNRVQASS